MQLLLNIWNQFKRTDKLRYRLLQWPLVIILYIMLAPIAFMLCIIVGLAWPIIGKDQ